MRELPRTAYSEPPRGVAQPGRAPRLGRGGFAGSNPAAPTSGPGVDRRPHIGEDGPDILSELGYSAADIDTMFKRKGVIAPVETAEAAE